MNGFILKVYFTVKNYWVPTEGEHYYYIDDRLEVRSEVNEAKKWWSCARIMAGNCFQNQFDAQAALMKIKHIFSKQKGA